MFLYTFRRDLMGLAQKPDASPVPQPGGSAFGNLFTKKQDVPTPPSAAQNDLSESITNVIRRLRIIETRFENMHKKMQFVEQNMLEQQKKLHTEIKTTTLDVLEVKRGLIELQNRMRTLVKEVQLRASREDVEVLKKYLQFWEPVKFVTAKQVESMIERALREAP